MLVAELLAAYQEYFKEHSEHWTAGLGYKEAGLQLLLQAFLQRVVNSGGQIEREYGPERMRTDLLEIWRTSAKPCQRQNVVIKCKLLRGSLEATPKIGLAQTLAYMRRAGTDEGHLVIFDRSKGASWDDKTFRRSEKVGGKLITAWGM